MQIRALFPDVVMIEVNGVEDGVCDRIDTKDPCSQGYCVDEFLEGEYHNTVAFIFGEGGYTGFCEDRFDCPTPNCQKCEEGVCVPNPDRELESCSTAAGLCCIEGACVSDERCSDVPPPPDDDDDDDDDCGGSCTGCETCIKGVCTNKCTSCETCDGGVCKAKECTKSCPAGYSEASKDACGCVTCEPNGSCNPACTACEYCDGGVCKTKECTKSCPAGYSEVSKDACGCVTCEPVTGCEPPCGECQSCVGNVCVEARCTPSCPPDHTLVSTDSCGCNPVCVPVTPPPVDDDDSTDDDGPTVDDDDSTDDDDPPPPDDDDDDDDDDPPPPDDDDDDDDDPPPPDDDDDDTPSASCSPGHILCYGEGEHTGYNKCCDECTEQCRHSEDGSPECTDNILFNGGYGVNTPDSCCSGEPEPGQCCVNRFDNGTSERYWDSCEPDCPCPGEDCYNCCDYECPEWGEWDSDWCHCIVKTCKNGILGCDGNCYTTGSGSGYFTGDGDCNYW